MFWSGLPASGLSISWGNTKRSNLEATSSRGRCFLMSEVRWNSLIAEWLKTVWSSLLKSVDEWACRCLSCPGTDLTCKLVAILARELGSSSREMILPPPFFFLNFLSTVIFAFFTLFPGVEWKNFNNIKVLNY